MGKDEPKRGKQLTSFLEELKAKHVTASDLSANERQVHVQVPPLKLKRVIDLLANYVAQMGEPFEEALRQRLARGDGDRGIDWSFLKEHSSPEAQYYRWRTFSFVQGDTRHHWRMEPFQMCTKGMVWHPPQRNRGASDSESSSSSRSRSRLSPGYRRQEDDFCAKWQLDRPARLLLRELPPELREQAMMKFNPYTEVKHADYSKVFAAWTRRFRNSKEEEHHGAPEANGRKRLGTERLRRRDVRDLERLLKDLSVNACDIRRAMVWCLDNDDMAIDVSRHLLDSLEEEDITAHERCLRLCLVSDILHNAASIYKPGAVVYRREFETHLPKTFEDFHRLFRGVKDLSLVHRILASWIERAIFTPKFTKGLEASMIKGIISAEGVKLPDALMVKVAEWQSQHFSQLEKICKVQGLNWDVQLSEKAEAIGGRFPEELRKKWLLDRLLTYELYVLETRAKETHPRPVRPLQLEPFEAFDPELDGESLDSDDEAYVRQVEQAQAKTARDLD